MSALALPVQIFQDMQVELVQVAPFSLLYILHRICGPSGALLLNVTSRMVSYYTADEGHLLLLIRLCLYFGWAATQLHRTGEQGRRRLYYYNADYTVVSPTG